MDVPASLWPVLVAPFAGRFLGVLIRRLPTDAPVVFGRSACPHCGTPLTGRDMVPLVSFVALRGRCRHCRQPIGLFHPAVELAAVAVALWAAWADPDPARLWADCGLGWALLTLAWIDWISFLLPDLMTLPLLMAGLTLTFVVQPEALTDHCPATALAYISFQGLAFGYRRLRGRDGVGGGDANRPNGDIQDANSVRPLHRLGVLAGVAAWRAVGHVVRRIMMGRWLAPGVVLLSCIAATPGIAGHRGPVCRESSVLEEMTREIRDRDYYSKVDPRLVTETSTPYPDFVQCQVCVQYAPYEMTRFGDQPIRRCLAHRFEVRILSNGFVVRDMK
jgi:leader peptidase (prepilin peptidase)/N-methyltransferase